MNDKLIFSDFLLTGMVASALLVCSCTDEEEDSADLTNPQVLTFEEALDFGYIDEQSSDTLDYSTYADSVDYYNTTDISAGFDSTAFYFAVLKDSSIVQQICYTLDFPVGLFNDHQQVVNFDDFESLSASIDSVQYLGFAFPISIKEQFGDKESRTVDNYQELTAAITDCQNAIE